MKQDHYSSFPGKIDPNIWTAFESRNNPYKLLLSEFWDSVCLNRRLPRFQQDFTLYVSWHVRFHQHELGQEMFLTMPSLTGTNNFQNPFNYLPFSQKKWLSKSSVSFDKHWTFQPSTWHMLIQVTVKLIMTQKKFKIIFKHSIHLTPSQYLNVKPIR